MGRVSSDAAWQIGSFLTFLQMEAKHSNDFIKLYKYRSLASLEQRNWFRRSIQEETIYFANPAEINDPYDCYPKVTISSEDSLRDYLTNIAREDAEPKELNAEVIDNLIEKYNDQKYLHEIVVKGFKYKSKTSIFCLSKTPTNTNQWTFYADEHNGVCLEYLVKNTLNIHKINYQNHRVEVEFPRLMTDDEYAIKKQIEIYTTKSLDWKIEDEVRLLSYGPAESTPLTDEITLSGIIFGLNTDINTEKLVYKWLSSSNLRITPTYINQCLDTNNLIRASERKM